MLELQILLANVLLPVATMMLTWPILRFAFPVSKQHPERHSSQPAAHPTPVQHFVPGSLMVVAGCLAVAAAFLVRVEVARVAWPEDAWAKIPHAMLLVGLASLISLWIKWPTVAWLVRATSVFFATRAIIPGGEGWEDIADQSTTWLVIIVAGTLLAWSLSERLPGRWPGILGLAWIASTIAAAFLTKDFLRVTEPMLAVASVLGMSGVMCLAFGQPLLASAVSGPMLFMMSAAVANAQFNSFAGFPDSLSWLAICSPGLAALTTCTVAADPQQPRLVRWKVGLLIAACLALAAAVIGWTAIADGAGGIFGAGDTEEW